jgi:hypothetical protein
LVCSSVSVSPPPGWSRKSRCCEVVKRCLEAQVGRAPGALTTMVKVPTKGRPAWM